MVSAGFKWKLTQNMWPMFIATGNERKLKHTHTAHRNLIVGYVTGLDRKNPPLGDMSK